MTFALSAEQLEIREAVARLCQRFGDDYWLKKDTEGGFPHEFHRAMADGGWLGVAMPVVDTTTIASTSSTRRPARSSTPRVALSRSVTAESR